jgi:glycosyltransferase involved in cell wall biosynthesis
MNKVLLVGPATTSRGGVASVLRRFTEHCVPEGYSYKMLATHRDGAAPLKLLTLAWALLRAPKALLDCDIVHIHTASRYSFLRKGAFVLLARLLRRPVVLQIHGGAFSRFVEDASPLGRWIIGRVLRSAQLVVALSKNNAAELQMLFADLRPKVIPNPRPVLHRHGTPRPQGSRIVFVGAIVREKGIFDLLQASHLLSRTVPDFELFIAGTGRSDEVMMQAAQLGIADRVRLTGWLSAPELGRLYESASVFCLPSYCEALPMALLEAMSYSLPIVTTPVGAIPELIVPQHTGCLIAPGEIQDLARTLERLITDRGFASRLGENAQRRVAQDFSPQMVASRLADLYDSARRMR